MIRKRIKNRRKHARRAAFIIVEYSVREGKFRDILKSIGAKGMFISTKRDVAAGQSISMTFPLFRFDEPVTISGQVVRNGVHGFAVVFDKPIEGLVQTNGDFPEIVHEINRKAQ